MPILTYILLGLAAGTVGGALGLGGGAIMVPAMVMLFGLSQHQAQGTALAVMLPPVFILAVLRYHASGNVKVAMALWICCGFVVGALIGAHYVHYIPSAALKRVFGIVLILIGIKMALLK